jgi:hypothetical protein
LIGHRNRADHSAEYDPSWRRVFVSAFRPSQPPTPDKSPINEDGTGPIENELLFRRGIRNQCVGERGHAGIKGPTCRAQRLVRFEHHRELGKVEAADIHKRARALRRGDGPGMGECIAHLAQGYEPEWRR